MAAFTLSVAAIDLKKIKLGKGKQPKTDFTEWVAVAGFEENGDDGRKLYLPFSQAPDSTVVIKGNVAVAGMDARKVFLATLQYAVCNFDAENGEALNEADPANNKFTVTLCRRLGKGSKEETYTRTLSVEAYDGGFTFETTDPTVGYKDKGILPKTVPMADMHPDTNPRHRDLVVNFVNLNSQYLNDMAEYAAAKKSISCPNLTDDFGGDAKVGMNPDEVLILLGQPMETRKSGEKERWIYDDQTVVIFEDSKVIRVVH